MDEEARELVTRLLKEGQRYDDVRRALISHGHTTEGFEDEYPEIQKELGIEEPRPTKVSPQPIQTVLNDDAKAYSDRQEKIDISNMVINILKLFVGLLVIAVAIIVLSGYGTTLKNILFGESADERSLNAGDVTHETTIKGMQISAQAYKAKLTDYGGLCTSIGIDGEVYSCFEDVESYAIEVPLSNDSYYCVDSTGFSDIIDSSVDGGTSCI